MSTSRAINMDPKPGHSPGALRLSWSVFALLFLLCGCGPSRAPDVIIIVMDTTRADHLGVYGYERPTTPNLKKFSAEAEIYDRAWSTASWTLPSHASLLTGRLVRAHGAHNAPEFDPDSLGDNPPHLPQSVQTLAEILARHGYRNGAFAGVTWLAPEFGLVQGYEVQNALHLRPAEEVNRLAFEWLQSIPSDQPVHLLVNYYDAHGPYNVPEGFDRFSDPETRDAARKAGQAKAGSKEDPTALFRRIAAQVERDRDLYDGLILYVDSQIGKLFEFLKTLGRYDDAVIIVTGDHGEGFGERGVVGHGAWLFDTVLRIPLMVRRPGGAKGGVRNPAPTSIVDVIGIIAEETGISLPPDVDTRPIGERDIVIAEERVSALFRKHKHLDRDLDAAIVWPYKLIVSSKGAVELYDLEADPSEEHNLADGERERKLLVRLRQELEKRAPPVPDSERRPMSPEAREQLRALGYLE